MNPDDIINTYRDKLGGTPSLESIESEREETLKKVFSAKALARLKEKALARLKDQIVAAYQILHDVVCGKRKIPASKIALLAGGLAYLALPLDIVCDVIPVVGLVDDAIVLTWIFSQCADVFKSSPAQPQDMVYPEFATSFFEKRGLSQCSRGSREKRAIIFI